MEKTDVITIIDNLIDEQYWDYGFPDYNHNSEFKSFIDDLKSKINSFQIGDK